MVFWAAFYSRVTKRDSFHANHVMIKFKNQTNESIFNHKNKLENIIPSLRSDHYYRILLQQVIKQRNTMSEDGPKRTRPFVLITGTPGTGKTSTASLIAVREDKYG
jgi:signal recognition particle GTPase